MTSSDCNQITLSEIQLDECKLIIEPPIVFVPTLTDSGHYKAEVKEFNLTISEKTVENLLQELKSQIRFIWEEYVLTNPNDLTSDALEFREIISSRIKQDSESLIAEHKELLQLILDADVLKNHAFENGDDEASIYDLIKILLRK